eukprot:COSAG05_NODE_561_length_8675_cov_3.694846_5_plen_59_part_00
MTSADGWREIPFAVNGPKSGSRTLRLAGDMEAPGDAPTDRAAGSGGGGGKTQVRHFPF